MAGPYGPFAPAQIDFSWLANLPQNFVAGQAVGRQGQLRSALSTDEAKKALIEGDYGKLASIIAQYDPELGMKLVGGDNAATVYGTPLPIQGPEGEFGYGAIPKRGGAMALVPPPPGWKALQPTVQFDTGGAVGGRGKYTYEPVGPDVPKSGTPEPGTVPVSPALPGQSDYGVRGAPGSKAAQELAVQPKARNTVSQTLQDLREAYEDLQKEGAVVDPTQGTVANIQARGRSSVPGQFVEGYLGTKAQTIRDRIETLRPGLVSAIRQATGMSARALDSNVELQFYLKQATDPTLGIEANFKALDALEEAYGSGQQAPSGAEVAPATRPGELPVFNAQPPDGGWTDLGNGARIRLKQ